jgi:hypothetical protein
MWHSSLDYVSLYFGWRSSLCYFHLLNTNTPISILFWSLWLKNEQRDRSHSKLSTTNIPPSPVYLFDFGYVYEDLLCEGIFQAKYKIFTVITGTMNWGSHLVLLHWSSSSDFKETGGDVAWPHPDRFLWFIAKRRSLHAVSGYSRHKYSCYWSSLNCKLVHF